MSEHLVAVIPLNPLSQSPDWETYFMAIATIVATRTHCTKHEVGSVIACMEKGKERIISTGYNGPPRGIEHCDVVGCAKDQGMKCRGSHSEMNALVSAPEVINGSSLFVTLSPCLECAKHIINSRVAEVVFLKHYAEGNDAKKDEADLAIRTIRHGGKNCRQFEGDLENLFARLKRNLARKGISF